MDDLELDAAIVSLDRATAQPDELLPLVERSSRATRARRITGRGRRLLTIGAGAGLVAATTVAGITYQDYLTSVSPFVGLEDGVQRVATPVVVHPAFTDQPGQRCLLYVELRGVSATQLDAAGEVLSRVDGDALSMEAADGAADQQAYSEQLGLLLTEQLRPAIPELRYHDDDAIRSHHTPLFDAYTITCRADADPVG